jgi:DEAD/DEAH box helicase domain protein
MDDNRFDPIAVSRHLANSYSEYLATTIRFGDPSLQKQLEEILSRSGFLSKGPFLEATPPYTKGLSIRQLVEQETLCEGMLSLGAGNRELFDPDLVLYEHQVKAIKMAHMGKNYIVTTGTGSGKTECFILPILDDILREQARSGPSAGVRAMILYPMNALANDQLKRLRYLLRGTKITFGRYVGDTPEKRPDAQNAWSVDHPGEDPLSNELLSREEMRATPPNILLTNYSMLEYLLLRPKDAAFFSSVFGSGWRHIAIDEAHVYSGTLGTEIAYLLRRLKARVKQATGRDMSLRCYATSATMGSDKDRPQIAKFAGDLFGEPFDHDENPAVIDSLKEDPMAYFCDDPWGSLPPERWEALRNAIADENPTRSGLKAALTGAIPDSKIGSLEGKDPRAWLSELLLGDRNSKKVVHRVSSSTSDPLDLTDLSRLTELEIDGLPCDTQGAAELSALVEVLSFAEFSSGVPILASRYHTFFRAPEGLFICPDDMTLSTEKTTERKFADGSSVPVYEVSVCRHCGEAYFLGSIIFTKECALLDPKRTNIDSDDYAARNYFRILRSKDDLDDAETLMWLCTKCGTLHSDPNGGPHRHLHESKDRVPIAQGIANEDVATCGHCGYQHRYAIQPMRVSPEAAGTIFCYDLVRDIPPFAKREEMSDFDSLFKLEEDESVRGGSVVCFSDRRQDAAFFAPAMLRTYNNITQRQMIRKAVDELSGEEDGCKPSDVARWIAKKLKTVYRLDGGPDTDIARRDEANAWVYDELMAEDSRNSLEGLGIIKVSPEPLIRLAKENGKAFDTLARRSGPSWMTADDYITILRVCLETLREQGALKRQDGAQEYMRIRSKQSPVVLGGSLGSPQGTIRFVPMPNSNGNKRSRFVMNLARKIHGIDISRDVADSFLVNLYEDLKKILGQVEKQEHSTFVHNDTKTEGFLLSADLWTLQSAGDDLELYLCDTCGCMLQHDTGGVCLTRSCKGHPRRVLAAKTLGKDRYYKQTYREDPLPIRVEEHTAQLSTKRAAAVQQDFIDGKVNVLSCTTTFELGVDVGDLRATFMRNVPPSPANYAQRAGRVGRRAGKPGFAVTFARLRPHDIEHYRSPGRIIAGKIRAPSCYLSNPFIAIRHIYAVVLSEYFRSSPDREDYSNDYNNFMRISEENPSTLNELKKFIEGNQSTLERLFNDILPKDVAESQDIAISKGSWIEGLVGKGGRLLKTHSLIHEDWDRLEHSACVARAEGKYDRASINMRQQGMLLKKRTISILAESGVIPKYGFPTDLVQLSLVEQENSLPEDRLDLSRGLRQAIYEYAPSAEIIAGKKVWESVGITKPRQRPYETRRFGICPNKNCRSFVAPIDTGENETECPLCHKRISLTHRFLIPSSGFRGREKAKSVAYLRRPRNLNFVHIKFAQDWGSECKIEWRDMPGGRLGIRHANNGHLYAINYGPSAKGFSVCGYCGAAAPTGEKINHEVWCMAKETQKYTGLGTDFTTDVLELTFALEDYIARDHFAWRSLMWALVQAVVSVMNIPEREIGATNYTNFDTGDESVLIYDDVPGGAGRALQLNDNIDLLLTRAYKGVSVCDCDESSCCYGCLCNYLNQYEHEKLSRGAARDILENLLHGTGQESMEL